MTGKIKQIDPIEAEGPLPPQMPAIHSDVFDSSSLREAKSPAIDIALTKPSLNPICDTFTQLARRVEPLLNQITHAQTIAIEKEFHKVQTLQQEEAVQQKNVDEAYVAATFWSMITDVSEAVSGAVSFTIGATTLSAGNPIAGGALIASGILSVGNLGCKYAGVWDYLASQSGDKGSWAYETFATYLPTTIGLTSSAFGILGSYNLWDFAGGSLSTAQIVLESVTSITSGVASLAEGVSQGKLQFALSTFNALRSNEQITMIDLENLVDDLKEFRQKQVTLHKIQSEILKETEEMIQQIQQPV